MKSSIKYLIIFSVLITVLACGKPVDLENTSEDPFPLETQIPTISETLAPLPGTVTPAVTPTQENQGILGDWNGTAQWLCKTNPVWQVQMNFSSDGKVSAILISEVGSSDTVNANWSMSGETITIDFPGTVWTGIVEENTISGTFDDENCSGVWLVNR